MRLPLIFVSYNQRLYAYTVSDNVHRGGPTHRHVGVQSPPANFKVYISITCTMRYSLLVDG